MARPFLRYTFINFMIVIHFMGGCFVTHFSFFLVQLPQVCAGQGRGPLLREGHEQHLCHKEGGTHRESLLLLLFHVDIHWDKQKGFYITSVFVSMHIAEVYIYLLFEMLIKK